MKSASTALAAATFAALFLAAPGVLAEGRVLTLDQALSKALAANPSITGSRESLAAAGHKVDGSWTGYLPQAVASLGYKRATANSPISPWIDLSGMGAAGDQFKSALSRESPDSYDNLSASLSVSQTIWDFGRTLGANRAANALRDASAADVATTIEGVRLSVIQAYYGVLATEEVVKAAEETRRQMEKHLAQARIQADAGVRQRIDVTRSESDLSTADLALLRARNGALLAKVNLDAAMGGDGDIDFQVVEPSAPAVLDVNTEQAVQEALDRRPEFRSLRAKVAAAGAGVTAARSAWFPALQATGGVAWTGYKFNDLPYNWFAGATLNWNLLSGVGAHAATQEAKANQRALVEAQRSLEVGIRSEVQSAVLNYREALQRIQPATALLESAKQTLALAEGRYAAGAGSIMEVTDAQAVWVQATSGLIGARYDLQTSRARVLKAIGDSDTAVAR
jgi:outer membrane protein